MLKRLTLDMWRHAGLNSLLSFKWQFSHKVKAFNFCSLVERRSA